RFECCPAPATVRLALLRSGTTASCAAAQPSSAPKVPAGRRERHPGRRRVAAGSRRGYPGQRCDAPHLAMLSDNTRLRDQDPRCSIGGTEIVPNVCGARRKLKRAAIDPDCCFHLSGVLKDIRQHVVEMMHARLELNCATQLPL